LAKAFAAYIVAEGVVPFTQRRFVFSDVGELHRTAAVTLGLLAAAEVRF
jgi:hypothetical protein